MPQSLDVDAAVRQRYSGAAQVLEPALCCPISYDPARLALIPPEVIERDYGCGDPTRYAREGEVVLDLGSGGGKACFLASQAVGPRGAVIGVDQNDDMLDLARRSAPTFAARVGFDNVRFVRAHIEDLRLDRDRLDVWLTEHPVRSERDLRALEREIERLRNEAPAIADESVDLVVSNCVLNLVRPEAKERVFAEAFRVLHRGGRAVISDIVCDEDVPLALRQDAELWSGCISGALREDEFLRSFERAGFYGLRILERDERPWQTVQGIEFRSLTLEAWKGKEGPCWDHNEAVLYRGPWKRVEDDDGHVLERGVRTAVCRKTFGLLTGEPYRDQVIGIEPRVPVADGEARPFPCTGGALVRDPRETKGADYAETTASCTAPGCC